jgi:hypothetical protein
LLLLAVSGLVVFMGAASMERGAERRSPASASTIPGEPPPLPSGAPPSAFEDLPADDERAAGCHFADRGFGDYGDWRKLTLAAQGSKVPSQALRGATLVWRALVPAAGRAVASDGSFRLLVHFHGAEPVRRQLAPEGLDLVIAAVDAGIGSRAYDLALGDPATFGRVIEAVEREVAAANHLPSAQARTIVLSSWSAGYGAVAQVLTRGAPRVGAVVLMDSLYAGYTGDGKELDPARVAPFLGAARAALAGGPAFYLTHTDIATPGYASTSEVASFLLGALGVATSPVAETDGAGPYPLRRMAEQGRLWIRGYAGADRGAHCAQLHLLPRVLKEAVMPGLP